VIQLTRLPLVLNLLQETPPLLPANPLPPQSSAAEAVLKRHVAPLPHRILHILTSVFACYSYRDTIFQHASVHLLDPKPCVINRPKYLTSLSTTPPPPFYSCRSSLQKSSPLRKPRRIVLLQREVGPARGPRPTRVKCLPPTPPSSQLEREIGRPNKAPPACK
jgi:hypothetical protein